MAVPRQLLRVTMILTMCLVSHSRAIFTMPRHPILPALPPTPGGTLCIPRERNALLDFKVGLTDPINFLSSWRGVECCQWTGVVCSNRTGHVIMLKINSGWPLDSFMDRKLDLSRNNFGGQPIPELIGSLGRGRLTHLDLSDSHFGGRIPPHLGNLSNLVSLQLNYMAHGSYSPDLTWVSCLQKLQVLGMSGVDLIAAVNWLHAINMLPRLTDLDLSYCALQNSMSPPAHSNLTSLESLSLIANSFNTSLGAKNLLWGLPSLQNLYLTDCGIDGPIPDDVGNSTSLQSLYLGSNKFTGMVPLSFQKLQNLTELVLETNFIIMDVAELLHRLGNFSSLAKINLDNNDLYGEVPVSIRELINLDELSLAHNNLHGTITEDRLTYLSTLQTLDISGNSLTVKVDSTWITPFNLSYSGFGSCILGPKFPSWLNQPTITYLDVSNTSIHDSRWQRGRNPSGFACPNPSPRENRKPVPVPINVGGLFDLVNYIVVGGVSKAMSTDAYTVEVEIKGQVLEYTKSIAYMVNLDFSSNSLSGQIPKEIGMLIALKNLNFSWNSLTDIIPQSIGALQALESFDLSHNGLSGEIPTSISSLTSLTRLNLSYNDLTGTIPSGNQLRTLEDQASIYTGNPGLCGPPVPRNCSRTDIIPYAPQEHNEGMSDVVSLYLSMCIGFVVGLWIVFCGFLLERKWRIGWFSFTDHMYDRAYVHVAMGWASLARNIRQG
ncbi:hypothetical protein VPH35_102067 [Triticum aestivum]